MTTTKTLFCTNLFPEVDRLGTYCLDILGALRNKLQQVKFVDSSILSNRKGDRADNQWILCGSNYH